MKKFEFEKLNFVETDLNKKNILITLSQIKTREYTYGYVFPLIEILKEHYNIYYFFEGGIPAVEEFGLSNVYRLNKGKYNIYKLPASGNLFRKKELDNSDEHNQRKIDECIIDFYKKEPVFDAIIIIDNHNIMLPFSPLSSHPKLKSLFNDYFDSFDDDDPDVLKAINETNEKLFSITAKGFSPLAFRYMYKNIMLSVIEHISKMHDAKVHIMIMDPSAAIPFFEYKKINHKFWYFTDDNRHLRNLHASPISELQHLVYEPHWQNIKPEKKNLLDEFSSNDKIPFFFAGSLLNDKGARKWIWRDFFKDFSYPGSELYFKLSLIYGMEKEAFDELGKEVAAHPNFRGDFMPNEEYMNVLKKCKTAFISRNVSANGGLTYRHIQYLYFGVLPIFDFMYDPEGIWIPLKFQEHLTVKNAEELVKRVDYYNTHEKERLAILKEMQVHFDVDGWIKDWRTKLRNTNLIKELC